MTFYLTYVLKFKKKVVGKIIYIHHDGNGNNNDVDNIDRFVGGETNACYNAVDRHVINGNGDRQAIIYDSPVTSSKRYLTYAELQEKVIPIQLSF